MPSRLLLLVRWQNLTDSFLLISTAKKYFAGINAAVFSNPWRALKLERHFLSKSLVPFIGYLQFPKLFLNLGPFLCLGFCFIIRSLCITLLHMYPCVLLRPQPHPTANSNKNIFPGQQRSAWQNTPICSSGWRCWRYVRHHTARGKGYGVHAYMYILYHINVDPLLLKRNDNVTCSSDF